MKSFFIFFIFLPISLLSQSVYVSYNSLNSFEATLHELFYCTLNNTGEPQMVYLDAKILKDGEPILIARSGSFMLKEGITTINSFNAESVLQSMSNISTDYIQNDIFDEILQTGYIPSGNYMFCLIVFNLSEEELSNPDVCHLFTSWPVTPPRLLLPQDNSDIDTELPLFSWTHVMPYKPSVTYNLQLVELFDGQGPFDAFQSNYIFYKSNIIRLNSFQYPISAPSLNSCRSYAWRIIGNYDSQQTDFQTQVFNTICDSVVEDVEENKKDPTASDVYYELSRILDASFYHVKGNFKIILKNSYGPLDRMKYALYDKDNVNISASNTLFNIVSEDESLSLNSNIFIVDIERLGLINDEFYVLEVQGPKRKYYMKIKYISEE